MLAKKYKLKKKNDFKKVFDNGKYYQQGFISLKFFKNNLDITRFGLIVSSKISKKAVERNKIKRRIENTIQINQKNIKTGFDIIILVRPEIVKEKYINIKKNLLILLNKL